MKLKLKISGAKVHDVGYMAFLLEAAEDLGLQGFYARNMTEEGQQAVIVYLEGDQALLAEFQKITQLQRPDKAEVSAIAFVECNGPVESIEVFAGRFQARQLRKGISSIIRIEDKQDRMLEKQDQMLSLQSRTIDKLDETKVEIIGKLDETKVEIIDKLDETKVEIRDEMRKNRDVITEKLDESQNATVKAIRDSSEAVIEELRDNREGAVEDIRDLRVDLRSSLDKKLSRMEKDISQLKAGSGP